MNGERLDRPKKCSNHRTRIFNKGHLESEDNKLFGFSLMTDIYRGTKFSSLLLMKVPQNRLTNLGNNKQANETHLPTYVLLSC